MQLKTWHIRIYRKTFKNPKKRVWHLGTQSKALKLVLHLFSYNKKKHLWACIKPITNLEIKVCWVVAYPKLYVVIDTYFMQLVCNFWQIECEIFLHQNLEIPFIYVTRLSYSVILCHLCKNMVVIWCNNHLVVIWC